MIVDPARPPGRRMTTRPTTGDACSWCGHPPHAHPCKSPTAVAADLVGVRLPRRYGDTVETIPCPCKKANPR